VAQDQHNAITFLLICLFKGSHSIRNLNTVVQDQHIAITFMLTCPQRQLHHQIPTYGNNIFSEKANNVDSEKDTVFSSNNVLMELCKINLDNK
jgi:hypothetical protein